MKIFTFPSALNRTVPSFFREIFDFLKKVYAFFCIIEVIQ